jgi:hypothetical protein
MYVEEEKVNSSNNFNEYSALDRESCHWFSIVHRIKLTPF